MNERHKRALAQSRAWINGDWTHNTIDDECTPDFGCCVPECCERNRMKRIESHNEFCKRHGYPIYSDDGASES